MPAGRPGPSKERLQRVAQLYKEGKTISEIALVIGVGRATIVGYLNQIPKLKRRGKGWGSKRPIKHGTAGYARGCRCDICTLARNMYNREYQRKRRAAQRKAALAAFRGKTR